MLASCKQSAFNNTNAENIFLEKTVLGLVRDIQSGNVVDGNFVLKDEININYVGNEGVTPLIWFMGKNDRKAVKFLLEIGADPHLVSFDGNSPYTLLAGSNRKELLKLVLEYIEFPNQKNENGYYPLQLALKHQHWDNVALLTESGASPILTEPLKKAPILLATHFGKYDIVLYFIKNGTPLRFIDQDGFTLAHSLESPSKDSKDKQKLKKMLLDAGVIFPIPFPPSKSMLYENKEELYSEYKLIYDKILPCYLGLEKCKNFSFPGYPQREIIRLGTSEEKQWYELEVSNFYKESAKYLEMEN
jgi:ankyrin repeat protein